MTQEEEYTIRSQLKWKRDGSDWVLLRGRRRMGRVTWAKDAVMAEGIRETAWKTRQQAA